MNKFDGLHIDSKFEEEQNNQKTNEDFFEPNNFDNVRPFNKKILTLKKSPKSNFFSLFFYIVICAMFITLGVFGYLKPVKLFLESEYNYKQKQLVSISELSEKIKESLNINQEVDVSKLEYFEIKKPFIAVDIIEDNGSLVFKNIESVFLKCGVDGTVKQISETIGGRRVEILCKNGCILVYNGLTYIGTKQNLSIKTGDIFGASNGNVVIELFYKTKKINLKIDDQGKIIWES